MVSGYCYGITTGKAVMSPGVWTDDALQLVEPGNFGINYRKPATSNGFGAINTTNLDYAVKAAMCDGKGAAWTADEQAAARERMGIGTSNLVYSYTLTEDVAQFEIPFTEYGDYVVYLYMQNNSTHQAEVTLPWGLCMLNAVKKDNPIAVTTGNIMKTSSAPFTWAFSIHVDENIVVCTNSYSVSWNSYAATSYSRFNKNIFGDLEKLIFGLSTAGERDVYLTGTVVNLYKVV